MRTASVRIVLGVLAIWLGVWPATDALTGASAVVMPVAEAAPVSGCCGGCAKVPTAEEAGGCCPTDDSSASRCAGAKSGRCTQCAKLSGMVLFTVCCDGVDPQLQCVGVAEAHGTKLISNHLQPPVPPPWSLS